MTKCQLSVVAGALSRSCRPKSVRVHDALAKRWRASLPPVPPRPPVLPDVISLMDAWIRRLEREARTGAAPQLR